MQAQPVLTLPKPVNTVIRCCLQKSESKNIGFKQHASTSNLGLFLVIGVAVACLLFAACSPKDETGYSPGYSTDPSGRQEALLFAVHPLYNPQRLDEIYGPLVHYLNKNISGAKFQLVASRSYAEFEKRLYNRQFHFALPNPYQTINSLPHGYRVFGKWGDDRQFRGIIIIRKDSDIKEVADLKGKTVSFPAPTALAATMMPLYYLHTHGLDVNRDIQRLFAGSQESSIMNVYLRKSAAGATWPPPWKVFTDRNPKIAAELMVKWETSPLINNGLVVRDDVSPEIVKKVASLLFGLQTHEEGRRLLAANPLAWFEPATNETYQPVYEFMEKYNATVH
ncbi:MAG: phosphate/phosphite/phosphonate ABC transporter substrate-binding protein [Deltaproteobacteria bacterium]|nr:phosphate/phosphite/phosphonate ABC transporter substrate-binding protein [Deltaproteobacteria bacterium]